MIDPREPGHVRPVSVVPSMILWLQGTSIVGRSWLCVFPQGLPHALRIPFSPSSLVLIGPSSYDHGPASEQAKEREGGVKRQGVNGMTKKTQRIQEMIWGLKG